jgi:RHS repeat-associated protein
LSVLFGSALALCAIFGSPCVSAAETVTYYYTNEQGTPLASTDANGTILMLVDLRPYGAQALGSPAQEPGYTGHMHDVDSDLLYMQARYYDSTIGRFLSVDPIERSPSDTSGFARYGYGLNNPISYIDEDGMEAVIPTFPPVVVTAPAPSPNIIRFIRTITVLPAAAAPPVLGAILYLVDANWFNREILGQRASCYGEITCAAQPNTIDLNKIDGKKVRRPGLSGKEAANDIPSKYRGARPNIGQSGKDFADEVVGKDPPGGKGPGSDWAKVKKYGDRGFQDP